jgi:pyruvate/2-oxoglutarate dehydrogenase complex dihydrolipoamide dehydrogenase (E3) component
MSVHYDAIMIGAGQAGPSLAGRLTAAGMKVALIERKLFGGTCVNTGCIPTKALVASAQAAHLARRAGEYGVTISGPVAIDMTAVKARKDAISAKSREGVEAWLRNMDRCTIYHGHARFHSSTELQVGRAKLASQRIFINVGGRVLVPGLPGIDRIPYLTNTTILELDRVPRHLVIVGGSYIGLEFAQMYRRFGSAVTVVEKGTRLVQREDPDISAAIQQILENEGIAIRLNAECIGFEPRGDEIALGLDCHSGEPEVLGSHVLLAVGRQPNTHDLGLDKAGVAVDDRGYIQVNDQLRTNVPGIWALGDCNGRGAFTHTAYNDFEIVAANLLDDEPRRVSDRIDAYALYIDPPLGRVGMTEDQARRSGRAIRVGMRPMSRVGRAVEKGETQGFMKIVVDAQSQAILGAAILGVGGDEAIHGVLDMMAAKAPYLTLQHTMHIHPTVSELIPTMLGELQPARLSAS